MPMELWPDIQGGMSEPECSRGRGKGSVHVNVRPPPGNGVPLTIGPAIGMQRLADRHHHRQYLFRYQ
jgi:hypothetical protein